MMEVGFAKYIKYITIFFMLSPSNPLHPLVVIGVPLCAAFASLLQVERGPKENPKEQPAWIAVAYIANSVALYNTFGDPRIAISLAAIGITFSVGKMLGIRKFKEMKFDGSLIGICFSIPFCASLFVGGFYYARNFQRLFL